MNWQRSLKGKLKINVPLCRHTSIGVGGPVQFWAEPKDAADLRNLVQIIRKKRLPLRVIGAGTNILVDDRGLKGMVVKLSSPHFKRITINKEFICAGAGLSLTKLARYAQEKGLSGFELLAGIPGTIGGALVMNAGNIGDRVLEATVIDKQSKIKVIKKEDIKFGYRVSSLGSYIILGVHFKLIKNSKSQVRRKIKRYLDYRKKTQDLTWPSCGCFFKNPSFDKLRMDPEQSRKGPNSKSAAYLIERCGLKGSFIGDAVVSSKHANFILNKGKASSKDIIKLIDYITIHVKRRFNLYLVPEVKIWK